jgi:trimeric autotransporter adhesin
MGAGALFTLVIGGCGLVSGLDEFEVVTQTSSTSSSSSSGGGGDFVTVGGEVSGLVGVGLVLRNNGADDIQIGKDGPFTFPAKVQSGSAYDVTIASSPSSPAQACTVSNGSGTASGSAITDVLVSCATSTYGVGGTVVGLTGSGLVLTNGGQDDLMVDMNGSFQFATKVASGSAFDIAVKTQPAAGGPCVVSGGTGTVGNADVTSALVNCASGTYTVGGTISGLVGTVILQQNGGADLNLTADGTFAFAQTLAPGTLYDVTVATQPSYPPRSQTCTVTNGSGTMGNANVTDVNVSCMTRSYTVGGNVVGSLGPIVLNNNGGDQITVNAAGTFVFPMAVTSGNTYSVTVATPPSGQTCTVAKGSGTMANGNVNDVVVNCNQGILCDGKYCALGTQECCYSNNTYTCADKCAGGGTSPIRCDSANDCGTGLVCCGILTSGVVDTVYCANASSCVAPRFLFCDPNESNPCPNGGTCVATDVPPGYYRCN